MRLSAYLKQEGLTQTEFARRLGLRVSTMNAYVTGQRRPPVEVVAAIEGATAGRVMAADFLGPAEYGISPSYTPPTDAERAAIRAGIAETQRIVRRRVPASVRLVDELIRDRRAEAAKE